MHEYINLSEWMRFQKLLDLSPSPVFKPKRSAVIKAKQRKKRKRR